MKKLFSYIYPITTSIPSEHNGTLEITWHEGKKYLNTKKHHRFNVTIFEKVNETNSLVLAKK